MRSFLAALVAYAIVIGIGYLALHSERELIEIRDAALVAIGIKTEPAIIGADFPPDCWFQPEDVAANREEQE